MKNCKKEKEGEKKKKEKRNMRTTFRCNRRHGDVLGPCHVSQDREDGKTRIETSQTVDDWNRDGIPVWQESSDAPIKI